VDTFRLHPSAEPKPTGSTVIELKPTNRAALQTMARRYRVKSLLDFCQGIVMELDREADPSTRVLFRVYED